ncbi:MAG: prolyl oligopeptidase family serine peptidase [Gemmatimonadetes bacterium]|uniref:S9 family peptidase n=1 Tax=Candidatus Kutchimonas denitrificans TaxID=3056748 RepID=A0AAE4Z8W7_9BACT|nr:S9 family peptidase [Gemmatimonadota bacterium]NIR75980.1 S9 family peptidase [Candidatus Kutchimonas denitrificans]NIT67998.1 S9 family peptidase [Gemmatimonadota bacterium]NIV24627.1 prolyl oligopeptidase family serine peptidase [Gemmatimonadota bacterium]NIY36575.1 prolyl oligopeptidase family serine peptidase [Gemmatimonadota bacterium]
MPHRVTGLMALSVLVVFGPSGLDAQSDTDAANAPLTVEEVVNFESFPYETPIQLSPDGEWVAYTVEYARRTTGSTTGIVADSGSAVTEVRITHTETGETVRVTDATSSSWGPSWSPNGARLAFFSNATGTPRLWVWDRDTRRVRQVSDVIVWAAWTRNAPRWNPDGTKVVVKLLPSGRTLSEMRRLASTDPAESESGVDGTTARVFRHEPGDEDRGPATPEWLRWRYGGDLAVIDLATGSVRRLTSGAVPVWWEVSPDRDWLAFVRFADPERLALGFRTRRVLAMVPLTGGAARDLPGAVRQAWGEAVSWSPRGDRLAYLTPGEGDEGGLFVADPEAGTRRRVAEARPGWAESFRGPLWSAAADALYFAAGSGVWAVDLESGGATAVAELADRAALDLVARRRTSTIWSPQGESVVVRIRDSETRKMGFARIDLSSGEVEALVEEEGVFSGPVNIDVSRDGSVVVVVYSDTRHAPDLWSMDGDLRRTRRLTRLNPGFRPDRLGGSRLVEWRTEDGRQLGGTLLLPPDYQPGVRVPLIVDVYGGGTGSREIHRFDRHRQLLATRGYAVLAPDVPLNTGTPMRDHARAVLPGVERVIELGIADADRIGVTGHSYGGYGTLALLTQSDRFQAAAASASHGNMVGMFADLRPDGTTLTIWAERGQGRMGGTPWEVRERYIENSPFFFLDRVEAPLLLLHGAEDRNTPVYLAGQVFVALQRLDRTVLLVRYEGEGHWPGSWSAANQIDYWRRIVAWFERHL